MSETAEAGRICRACGSPNAANAQRCAKCGADMGASEARFVDDDPALRYVDPENRVELERFSRFDHAQLACGLLRSNGIPCELSSPPLPGLPADIIMWVHNRDAKLAWALLEDTERSAPRTSDDAA